MSATELSRAVVARALPALDDRRRECLRRRLVEGVAAEVERLPEGETVEVNLALLRRATARPELLLGPAEPFAWQPKFVRRSLGLALVDACAEGRFRAPAEAAGPVASEAVDEWGRTGWKAFHWEPWFAGLEPASRAVVLAEAVSWATALWTAFDWNMIGPGLRLGGPDEQWVLPVPRTVRLKSRCELRAVVVAEDRHRAGPGPLSLVSVSGGTPTANWSEELGFLALVGLRSSSRPLPARVTGLWPDAGTHRIVEIDQLVLEGTVDRVIAAVAVLVDARLSSLACR